MTIASVVSRTSYAGAGSIGPFAYPFKITTEADLLVTKRSSIGGETNLIWPLDFTVTGVLNGSGTITLNTALLAGETLFIRRKPANTQPMSIRNQGAYFPATIEDEFDRMAMQILALQDSVDRSLKLKESIAGGVFTELEPEAGKVVTGTGSGFTMSTLASTGVVALPGAGRTVTTLSQYLINNAVFAVADYFPGGYVLGTSDTKSAIQAAYDQAKISGGTVLLPLGAGAQAPVVLSGINCANAGAASQVAVQIVGYGPRSTLINAKIAGAAVFDCTGTSFLTFRDFATTGNLAFMPTTAFLLARNSTSGSAQDHIFWNVHCLGYYSTAAVYNYAAEVVKCFNCQFTNSQNGASVVVHTGTNIKGLTSVYATIATGAISNRVFNFFGCELNNYAASGNSDCLYLESSYQLNFVGGMMFTNFGRAMVFIDASAGFTSNCAIRDTLWDGANTTYGVLVIGANDSPHFTLDNIYDIGVKAFAGTMQVPTGGLQVYAQDGSIMSFLRINKLYSPAGAYVRLYQTNYSEIKLDTGATLYLKYACAGNEIRVTQPKLTIDRYDLFLSNTVYDLGTGAVVNMRQSLDRGDANVVLLATDAPTVRFDSALTVARTVTMPANAASTNGQKFRIRRKGVGAGTLTVQDPAAAALKVMPAATAAWADVEFLNGAWELTGYAPL